MKPLDDIESRGFFICVPGMARIQLEINQPQVVTAKCSEPQVVDSDVEDGGSGAAHHAQCLDSSKSRIVP